MKACLIGTPFELAAEHIAMRDPLRIAARPFARALVQAATRSGDHLSNLRPRTGACGKRFM